MAFWCFLNAPARKEKYVCRSKIERKHRLHCPEEALESVQGRATRPSVPWAAVDPVCTHWGPTGSDAVHTLVRVCGRIPSAGVGRRCRIPSAGAGRRCRIPGAGAGRRCRVPSAWAGRRCRLWCLDRFCQTALPGLYSFAHSC